MAAQGGFGINTRACAFWEFLSYIWNFEHRFAPRIIQEIERHGSNVPVVTLKSHGEMAQLLDLAGLPH
ncbi:MAG: hypothetical protein O9309_11355 [Rhizobium sp.]|nr:hypothetical protein [Rhizobium sp.]MCZ8349191.1 hypothetical protein [Rhizobium sp.]